MSFDWKSILTDGSWFERFSSPRGHGLVLWVGLALLTLSLLVLMRTRWGQAKPLSKCVVLSVFAHILFLGYAYGTKLIFDHPAAPEEQFIRLSVVAPSEELDVDSSRQTTRVWEESFTSTTVDPAVTLPDRQMADVAIPERDEPAEAPDVDTPPNMDVVPNAEPDRELEAPSDPSPATPLKAAPSEVAIASPTAERQESPETPLPENEPLSRLETESDTLDLDSDTRTATPDTTPPTELLENTAQLQRLTDVTVDTERADAVADTMDRTNRADNRDAQEGATVADSILIGSADAAMMDRSSESVPFDQVDSLPQALAVLPVVRRLGDSAPLPELYRLRSVPDRLPVVRRLGGSARTETAVDAALSWLAAAQQDDGRWDASDYGSGREDRVRGHDRQRAGTDADTGITGLALLAFLGAGHTHFEGEFRSNVQLGLEYIIRNQQETGSLAGEARLFARMYCHGIATLAVSEAYAMTGDHRLQPFVERAVRFSVSSQHSTTGGWRYQPGDQGDTSQLGWQVMALKSAELAGINVPRRTHVGIGHFLDGVASGAHGGLASYRINEAPSRTMTAEALACRFFLEEYDEAAVREGVRYIMGELPRDGKANLYYWYYATLALYQLQDREWESWNTALQEQLLSRQRTGDGALAGSWDADTVWGGYGGRVYSTALAALCLEVYYRYLPLLVGESTASASRSSTTR